MRNRQVAGSRSKPEEESLRHDEQEPKEAVIQVVALRKSYGSVEALRGIDLVVHAGEVFALLGPNGAGKTTTVEILEGHRRRGSGDVRVFGHDPEKAGAELKRRVGIVLQSTGVEPYLTVAEIVEQFRGFYPRPRPLDEILQVVGLQTKRNERVKKLSGGQQRRLDVAIGLAGDPDLLFLDEPTSGFDPAARRRAWDMVKNLKALGKTVFLTTHYMDEAQHLADRAAIIVRGEIVARGSPDELRAARGTTLIRFEATPGAAPPARLRARVANGEVEIETDQPTKTLHDLTRWALERDIELQGLSVSRASLEDVYLELTSPAERGDGP